MRVVYHWENGAYLNDLALDFDGVYREMCEQFGFPILATVNFEDDWRKKPILLP